MQTIYILIATLALWSCGTKPKKEPPKAGASATPVTTTQPPSNGGTFGPNKGFGEEGKGTKSDSAPKSSKNGTTKPKSDDEDPKESDDEEDVDDEDDEADKGRSSTSNRFVKLQTDKCAKTSAKTCKSYGLNAPRSKASFCPYSKSCAEGKCKLPDVLAHFCNCIYQLERGRTFFNGKEHDCVAEYQSAR